MSNPLVIEVQNSHSKIVGALSKICIDQIKFATSYAIPGAHFSKAFQRGFWNGRRDLFETKNQTFPTGLLSKVRALLVQNGLPHSIKDLRVRPKPTLAVELSPSVQLRPYQVEAVASCPKKQRGVIKIATGGGKSLVASGIIANLKVPTVILVHKRDLLWQLVETLESTLGVPIGKIGAGKVEIHPISVCMIQTAARLFDPKVKVDKEELEELDDPEEVQDYLKQVSCVIADEAHHLASVQYETVLSNCPSAFYRFGLSATPFRADQADLLIESHTAPKFVDISASYLIENGYLAQPTIYMYQFKHKRQPTDLSYAELYTSEVVNNTGRNTLIVELAQAAVNQGKTALVSITRVEHGHILEGLLKQTEPSTIFAHGQMDSLDRKEILKELNLGKRKIVISTTVFGEGVDVPNLAVLINAKAAESSVDSLQLAGRVLRITPTKNTATIIDIADAGCRFLEKHATSRSVTYKLEPKYNVKEVKLLSEVQF